MALRWIHENIAAFNGDKDSITLFGPGAGAAAAGLLMVNPRTQHIVTKVIAQVRFFVCWWQILSYRRNNSYNKRPVLGCGWGCPAYIKCTINNHLQKYYVHYLKEIYYDRQITYRFIYSFQKKI